VTKEKSFINWDLQNVTEQFKLPFQPPLSFIVKLKIVLDGVGNDEKYEDIWVTVIKEKQTFSVTSALV